ncbi:OmpH family outer membrane protein [Ruegeria sp. R14_0]|uniref:OmpH family outer membrane protein n=1 Tax=Ruegeria sp. R14_0 TaxID=2821100 RepID=UPI001ADD11CB|nr:OmpH family outer membrane protein [Ruegeria sp. R14_0]MBO9445126.1 OmpH family outer membrane protein [Ruegeria sp. R14_0]
MLNSIYSIVQGPSRALCILLALIGGSALQAQQLGVPQAEVLTLSSDRLFTESQFGQRVLRQVESESALLAQENERIVAELSKEEKDLTEKRAELEPEEFRPLAEAFDNKVQSHREGQRAKLDALARQSEEARQTFFELAQPILIELLRESGASIVIERSNVFLSSDRTDVTDAAIARINELIGDGSQLENQGRE